MSDKIADFYRATHSFSNDQIVAIINRLESIVYARQNQEKLCTECGHIVKTPPRTYNGRCGAHGPNSVGRRGILYRPHRCYCKNEFHKGAD